jgi:ROS/MUCR transcriptional regulator protein
MKVRVKTPRAFKTRREVERYFGGKTIECLLCAQRFRRLAGHLAAKHEMSVDEYRLRFGLPWSRGLTSASSVASSGWSAERKAQARKLARKIRFFELAHLTPRRVPAPFLKAEAVKNLGKHAVGFGEAFERRVRALFDKGLTDAAIAQALGVGRATVTYRTMHWRKRKHMKA